MGLRKLVLISVFVRLLCFLNLAASLPQRAWGNCELVCLIVAYYDFGDVAMIMNAMNNLANNL